MEIDDIESKIACNELTAAQVFTQMKQHINKCKYTTPLTSKPDAGAKLACSDRLLRDAMLATYSSLQNKKPDQAKTMLRTGLMGGSVNNPLDIERCNKEWLEKYTEQ